ncbi:hypothetical protein, conserved [Eimeria necatrix]|uniref:Stress-response A/B barrel domain-containing protein n=1 Tax=Eimeria necatrix TaxID=51315 RepID=U6MM88_9EIME|nr:hypothetical protein, conserved [Eimeria necatrix]CDJ65126.1 hypothetical protein, conserved [Eimeria necatrix]
MEAAKSSSLRLVHIVCFKFKQDTPVSVQQSMRTDAEALKNSITTIPFSLFFRPTFTHERAKGFTHVLHSQFNNRSDLETYSKHPQHLEFLSKYRPHFEDVMAVDIEL